MRTAAEQALQASQNEVHVLSAKMRRSGKPRLRLQGSEGITEAAQTPVLTHSKC